MKMNVLRDKTLDVVAILNSRRFDAVCLVIMAIAVLYFSPVVLNIFFG